MKNFNYWLAEYKKLRGIEGEIDIPALAKKIQEHLDIEHKIFTDGCSFVTFIKVDDAHYKDDYGNVYTLEEITKDGYKQWLITEDDLDENRSYKEHPEISAFTTEHPTLHIMTDNQRDAMSKYDINNFTEPYTVGVDNLGYLRFQLNDTQYDPYRCTLFEISNNFADFEDDMNDALGIFNNPLRKSYNNALLLFLPQNIRYEQLKPLGMTYTFDYFMSKYKNKIPPEHNNAKIECWKQIQIAEGQLIQIFNRIKEKKVQNHFLKKENIDIYSFYRFQKSLKDLPEEVKNHLGEAYQQCQISQADINDLEEDTAEVVITTLKNEPITLDGQHQQIVCRMRGMVDKYQLRLNIAFLRAFDLYNLMENRYLFFIKNDENKALCCEFVSDDLEDLRIKIVKMSENFVDRFAELGYDEYDLKGMDTLKLEPHSLRMLGWDLFDLDEAEEDYAREQRRNASNEAKTRLLLGVK